MPSRTACTSNSLLFTIPIITVFRLGMDSRNNRRNASPVRISGGSNSNKSGDAWTIDLDIVGTASFTPATVDTIVQASPDLFQEDQTAINRETLGRSYPPSLA